MDGLVVTVSPIGISNPIANPFQMLPNDGANYGPDTIGTATNGIQEAVNAVIAAGGGRVLVRPGVYLPPTNYVLIQNATDLVIEFDRNAHIQHNPSPTWSIDVAPSNARKPLFLLSKCTNVRITGGYFSDAGVNGASPFYREVFYVGDNCTNIEIDHTFSTGILGFAIRLEGQWQDANNSNLHGNGPIHEFREHHNTGIGNGFNKQTNGGTQGATSTDGGGVRVSNSTGNGSDDSTVYLIDELDLGDGDYWGFNTQAGGQVNSVGLFVGLSGFDFLSTGMGPVKRVKLRGAVVDMGVFTSSSTLLGSPIGVNFEALLTPNQPTPYFTSGEIEVAGIHVIGGVKGLQISAGWHDIIILASMFEFAWEFGASVGNSSVSPGYTTSRITFIGCGAYNNNQSKSSSGTTRAGFVAGILGGDKAGTTELVTFIDCDASDNQLSSPSTLAPTQSVGFIICSQTSGGTAQHILLKGCRAVGNVTAGRPGMLLVTSAGGAILLDVQVREFQGYNPFGFSATTPAVSAIPIPNTNPYRVQVMILTIAGATTAIVTDPGGTPGSSFQIVAGQEIELDPGATITLTYGTAPTWKWYGE